MAERATAALAGEEQLLLTDLVLAECVYVLESFYEVKRARVAALMRSAIALASISVIDARLVLRALEIYEVQRLDFAEAYLVASAESTGVRRCSPSTARSTASSRSPESSHSTVNGV
jgi:predicted nucleic-acid-binding protein